MGEVQERLWHIWQDRRAWQVSAETWSSPSLERSKIKNVEWLHCSKLLLQDCVQQALQTSHDLVYVLMCWYTLKSSVHPLFHVVLGILLLESFTASLNTLRDLMSQQVAMYIFLNLFLLIHFQQNATLHSLFISGKLLYMFQVVSPPITRSTKNCIYSIWNLSNRYYYLPLLWKSCNWFECCVGIVLICFGAVADISQQPHQNRSVGNSNGLTSTRYCKYSCLCYWWWVEIPPETCRAVFQK